MSDHQKQPLSEIRGLRTICRLLRRVGVPLSWQRVLDDKNVPETDMTTRLTPLIGYLAEIGVIEADLMADPRRPLIYQIGPTRYVDRQDARSWETSLQIKALYR